MANAEAAVYSELLSLFAPRDAAPWPRVPAPGVPAVILVVGVNGTGKTTIDRQARPPLLEPRRARPAGRR